MLLRSISMQLRIIWERKIASIILFLLFCLILINYFNNVMTYRGTDVIDMYHPMKLLTLSNYSEYSFYLLQYFPLLVVIPAGFALFADKTLNQYIFIQSRIGARNYYFGKLIVVFLVTFTVFTLPFLLEILLNCLAFPITGIGDPSNLGYYSESYIESTNMYLFSSLYLQSPYLYAVFFTVVFGVFSGVLAMFTVAISTFQIKYKVLLFLPIYLLLHGVGMIIQLVPSLSIDTNYFLYLRFYEPLRNSTDNLIAFFTFIALIFSLSILIVFFKLRKGAI